MRGTVYNATAPTLGDGAQLRDARVDAEGRLLTAASADVNAVTAAMITLTAAGAGTTNGADQTNLNRRGLQLGINVTAMTGTPTLTVTVQGKDAVSGTYYTLLVSAAIAATGFTLLTVYPGALTTANVSTPQPVPLTWRVIAVVAGGTPAVTATIGANLIV